MDIVAKITIRILSIMMILGLLSACGGQEQGGAENYEQTKTMVVDILKTEEAQKAIEEAKKKKEQEGGQSKIKQMLSSPEGQQIQVAVKDVLTDPQYPEMMKELMTDPKFAGEFAKTVQKENKEIHKELMKDPEYQTLLIDVMKSGDYEKLMIDILKSKEYRKQTMTVLQESLENPIFKAEMLELMKKAMEEQSKPKQEKGGGGSGGGGS
jgi:spore germination protein D